MLIFVASSPLGALVGALLKENLQNNKTDIVLGKVLPKCFKILTKFDKI